MDVLNFDEVKNCEGKKGNTIIFMKQNHIDDRNGFVIGSDVCKYYLENKCFGKFKEEILSKLNELEEKYNKRMDDTSNPLFLTISCDSKQSIKGLYKNDIITYSFGEKGKDLLFKEIEKAFNSWNNERAYVQRKIFNIPFENYLEVYIQETLPREVNYIVGEVYTREITSGENIINGSFHFKDKDYNLSKLNEFDEKNSKKLEIFVKKLEKQYKNAQKIDFEINNGSLYILDVTTPKLSKRASLKIAVDLAKEGIISEEDAIMRIKPSMIDYFLHTQFDVEALKNSTFISKGLPASPGAGCGKICLSPAKVRELIDRGEKTILVCNETSPEDIEGMAKVQGVLMAKGGMTSHASVVARGMGTTCVAGCEDIKFLNDGFSIGDKIFKEGDYISIDGNNGNVYDGGVKTLPPSMTGEFATILEWADKHSKLEVRANADNPKDSANAYNLGAKGVGLCRTEHMFFHKDRIKAVREMIVSSSKEERKNALSKILPMQKDDFKNIYKSMKGYPVTIRFLDPPLHEFLPKEDHEIRELAEDMGLTFEKLKEKVEYLHEFNPMMGHRGLRLAVTYPEIAEMQTQAVIEASIEVNDEMGWNIVPEIMIPLTSSERELKYVREIVCKKADEIIKERGVKLKYKIGTMIEIPRACVTADEIAKQAEFFSFGTNDLTQMTYGFSRDDAGKFLDDYYSKDILACNPFGKLDKTGVGQLVQMACEKGRKTRPDIKLGICGEHGGEPSSIEFCHKVGLDYVSCSPFRVPVARISTAQANIKNKEFAKN